VSPAGSIMVAANPHPGPATDGFGPKAIAIKMHGVCSRPAGLWQVLCARSARCQISSGILTSATSSGWPERRK
jgi:hypothetical protein